MATAREREIGPRRRQGEREHAPGEASGTVTLRHVAAHLGLSPATVSLVLNQAPAAAAIPAETQERIFAAARELDYRPNYLARSLRSRRTFSVGRAGARDQRALRRRGDERHRGAPAARRAITTWWRATAAPTRACSASTSSCCSDRAVEGLILVASELHAGAGAAGGGGVRARAAARGHQRGDRPRPRRRAHPRATSRSWGTSASPSSRGSRAAPTPRTAGAPSSRRRQRTASPCLPELTVQLSGEPVAGDLLARRRLRGGVHLRPRAARPRRPVHRPLRLRRRLRDRRHPRVPRRRPARARGRLGGGLRRHPERRLPQPHADHRAPAAAARWARSPPASCSAASAAREAGGGRLRHRRAASWWCAARRGRRHGPSEGAV